MSYAFAAARLAEFLYDTGATGHFTDGIKFLFNYREISPPQIVGSGFGSGGKAIGTGQLRAIFTLDDGTKTNVVFNDVLHVPGLGVNLISGTKLMRNGLLVTNDDKRLTLSSRLDIPFGYVNFATTPQAVIQAEWVRPDSSSQPPPPSSFALTAKLAAADQKLWHERLGHCSADCLLACGDAVDGLEFTNKTPMGRCQTCSLGKMTVKPTPGSSTRISANFLDMVAIDIWGPATTTALEKVRYAFGIVDEATRFAWAIGMRDRRNVLGYFQDWRKAVELKDLRFHPTSPSVLKGMRSDHGSEFTAGIWADWSAEEGLAHEFAIVGAHGQNGIIERLFRTILNTVRTWLIEAGLPLFLWWELFCTGIYIHNRRPTRALDNTIHAGKTPVEAATGVRPDISNLRRPGCLAIIHIPQDDHPSKLANRGFKAAFVGYSDDHTGWRFYVPSLKRVVPAINVDFFEDEFFCERTLEEDEELNAWEFEQLAPAPDLSVTPGLVSDVPTGAPSRGNIPPDIPVPSAPSLIPAPTGIALTRPRRDHVPPVRDDAIIRHSRDGVEINGSLVLTANISVQGIDADGPGFAFTSTGPTVSPDLLCHCTNLHCHATHTVIDSTGKRAYILRADFSTLTPSLSPSGAILSRAVLAVDDDGEYKVYTCQLDTDDSSAFVTPDYTAFPVNGGVDEPTFNQAMNGPDASEWRAAIEKERAMLRAMGTWDRSLVPLPPGRRALLTKWVLLIKRDDEGNVIKYKARLVARGDMQTPGVDYVETFAPTVRLASICVIYALAAELNLELRQFDVSSAYLHGILQEEVYLRQATGFVDPDHPHLVHRLRKSLYGLCQAGHEWNRLLHATLVEFGFVRTDSDHGVYVYEKDGEHCILAIHVDDGLVATKSMAFVDRFYAFLRTKFEIQDLGDVELFCGVRIRRDRAARLLTIDQRGLTRAYVERFIGGSPTRPVASPCDTKVSLVAATPAERAQIGENSLYSEAVGALLWLSLSTRPDIAFAVSLVARFTAAPGTPHWTAVKRIFRYLQATPNYGLRFSGHEGENGRLKAMCDADLGGDKDSRKSMSAYVFTMCGAAVDWLSRLQKSVACSTVEAEYMSLSLCARNAVWLRNLLAELGRPQIGPTLLRGDNEGSLTLAVHPSQHQRTKHIDIHYHNTRNLVTDNIIILRWIPTREMIADMLTKPMDGIKMKMFSAACGLVDILREGSC
ncbi:putative transposase, partial [Phenoliferia sp. Uapishka_3]